MRYQTFEYYFKNVDVPAHHDNHDFYESVMVIFDGADAQTITERTVEGVCDAGRRVTTIIRIEEGELTPEMEQRVRNDDRWGLLEHVDDVYVARTNADIPAVFLA